MSAVHSKNTAPDPLLLATILDSIGESITVFDTQWRFVYINQAAAQLSGFTLQELIGQQVWEKFPQARETEFYTQYHRAMQEQIVIEFETYYSPTNRWYALDLHPTPDYLVVHSTNITARKQAEETAQHHLQEIETLNARLHRAVQETHHRIKNNLQVITALVEMQESETNSDADNAHLRRINQHVCALATIHDLLTQETKNDAHPDGLNMQEVLGQVIPMLQQTSGNRRIVMEIADITLSIGQSTALSLLVSECVGNAIKHAQGTIDVTLRIEGTFVRLEVCDDGNGFPPNFDPRKSANTGIELIESAARWDLRGEVEYINREQGGGCVAVVFPLTLEPTAEAFLS